MMSEELKLALQALGAISEKDTRMGSLKEVFRLFQRVHRMVYKCYLISCNVDSRNELVKISMYFYPDSFQEAKAELVYYFSAYSTRSSFMQKKDFFGKLEKFIKNIKNYYYEQQATDPTRANILP